MPRNERRVVLVTRFSALGDVAMTVPALYAACRANPQVRFVMVTRPGPAALLVDEPENLTVVAADLKEQYRGLPGALRLARHLRRQYGITDMADLHNVLRTWVIGASMRLHGIAVRRLDKQRRVRRNLLAHKPGAVITPTIERYRQVFERLRLSAPAGAFIRLFDGDPLPDSDLLAAALPTGRQWIAIAPFTAHEGKAYPADMMSQVIDRLASVPDVHLFLFGGGPTEAETLRQFATRHSNVTSLADTKHSFIDEFAVMSHCRVMLSMDSANMHLASLVGLPVVSVWGATAPECGFMGWRQEQSGVVQLDLPCRPCAIFGERPCRHGDYRCLRGIDPELIVRRVVSALGREQE